MYLLWNFFSSLNFCILSSMLTPRIQLSLICHHNNFTVLTNRTFLFNSSQLYSCHMVNISNTLLFHLRRYHLDFRHWVHYYRTFGCFRCIVCWNYRMELRFCNRSFNFLRFSYFLCQSWCYYHFCLKVSSHSLLQNRFVQNQQIWLYPKLRIITLY
jgi:hypothetical protein